MPARRPRKRARDAASSDSPDADKADFPLNARQWRYLEDLELQVDAGQLLTQEQTAKRIHVRRQTVSEWNRLPGFRRAVAKILREGLDPLDQLVDRAVARKAMQGNPRFAEINLRRRGLWDGPMELQESRDGVQPAAQVTVGVQFVGLPQPPTPQQAEAMRPPPGSTMVVTAAGVLEDRGRK